jgi:hypothetical protein
MPFQVVGTWHRGGFKRSGLIEGVPRDWIEADKGEFGIVMVIVSN